MELKCIDDIDLVGQIVSINDMRACVGLPPMKIIDERNDQNMDLVDWMKRVADGGDPMEGFIKAVVSDFKENCTPNPTYVDPKKILIPISILGDVISGGVCITEVVFNPPATIVFWSDGTKTVVKNMDINRRDFDPEKGLAMAICKKLLANGEGRYYEIFKYWLKHAKYTDNFPRRYHQMVEKSSHEEQTNDYVCNGKIDLGKGDITIADGKIDLGKGDITIADGEIDLGKGDITIADGERICEEDDDDD